MSKARSPVISAVSPRFAWCLRSRFNTLDDFFSHRKDELFGELANSIADSNLLASLPAPELFKDLDKAVKRILCAFECGERVTIFGDYDVDGTTSCAMLRRFFAELNLPVNVYIPERLVEGYGLNPIGLERIAQSGGGLVITVDNGIAAVSACARAKELGIDVIVTDHHEIPEVLPEAFAIINPKQKDCNYPFKMLAGVGVAFYLMIALRKALREKGHPTAASLVLKNYLDFVAIGTIADVAPLNGVNHILCKVGLQVLTQHVLSGQRLGVATLLRLAGWSGEEPVSSSDVGFKIGPRLNAAGRLGTALATEELLSCDEPRRARELAELLHGENSDRQFIEKAIKEQAFQQLTEMENIPEAIVLYHPEWHTGVVGIVASRVLEKFYRPTLILGSLSGKVKGSGRSTHAFDLFSSLNSVRDEFISFGGHFHAVGLTIDEQKLGWLREHLSRCVRESLSKDQCTKPLYIDAEVPVNALSMGFIDRINQFEPFGVENPRPRFLIRGAELSKISPMGKDPSAGHAQVVVSDGTGEARLTVFSLGNDLAAAASKNQMIDIVVEGKTEIWRNQKRLKLQLVDFLAKAD